MRSILIVLSWIFSVVSQIHIPKFGASLRVIGGTPATIENYPIVAQLLLDSRGNKQFVHYCAGVILTARHVLSTAHCFQYNKGTGQNYTLTKYWKIRVGSTYRSRGGNLLSVMSFSIHPSFDKNYFLNDVALVVTKHAIPFSNNVRQATISQSLIEIKSNSVVTLVGWGISQVGGQQSEQLLKANMVIIDQNLCKTRYNGIGAIIQDSMICAGKLVDGDHDGCYGDSGGPLIFNGYVIGLVSFGYACGHSYYPGVYTKISHFTDWIIKRASDPL